MLFKRNSNNQRTDELLKEWNDWLSEGRRCPDMSYLKDRNRQVIFLFVEKKLIETRNQTISLHLGNTFHSFIAWIPFLVMVVPALPFPTSTK